MLMIAELEFTKRNNENKKKKNRCNSVMKKRLSRIKNENKENETINHNTIDENQRPSFFPGF